MKRIALPLLPLAAAAALATATLHAAARAEVRPTQDDAQDEPETELGRHMLVVQDGLRALRRSLRDPAKNAESLATVVECQTALFFCKTEPPAMAERVPEGERAAFVRDFRIGMIEIVGAFLSLEKALLEGQDPDALKEIYNAIKELEDPAHERFTEDG